MGVPAKVEYDPSHNSWFAWEGPLWRRILLVGEIGMGKTPDKAYQNLLQAVERRERMKAVRCSPIYFDADGNRRSRP